MEEPDRKFLTLAFLCVFVAGACGALQGRLASAIACGRTATNTKESEYQVKAAFLYHFAKLTRWPDSAFKTRASAFVIAIVGKDPFGADLDRTLSRKMIDNRKIEIRRLEIVDDVGEAHLLFVGSMEKRDLESVLRRVERRPVLLVGETRNFARSTGMIGLLVEKKRVRFEINTRAAREAGLRFSSELLKLARVIGG